MNVRGVMDQPPERKQSYLTLLYGKTKSDFVIYPKYLSCVFMVVILLIKEWNVGVHDSNRKEKFSGDSRKDRGGGVEGVEQKM